MLREDPMATLSDPLYIYAVHYNYNRNIYTEGKK